MCTQPSVNFLFPTAPDGDGAGASVPVFLDTTAHECGNADFGIAGLRAVLQGFARDDSIAVAA